MLRQACQSIGKFEPFQRECCVKYVKGSVHQKQSRYMIKGSSDKIDFAEKHNPNSTLVMFVAWVGQICNIAKRSNGLRE